MDKQNASNSSPGVRVPPRIKIKALEAVKVCTLAAHKPCPESLCQSRSQQLPSLKQRSHPVCHDYVCKRLRAVSRSQRSGTLRQLASPVQASGLQETEYQVSPSTPLLSTAIDENGWVCGTTYPAYLQALFSTARHLLEHIACNHCSSTCTQPEVALHESCQCMLNSMS